MSNDLISREKLISDIRNSDDVELDVIEAFLDLQPTAYDVDKVVEEISGADCDRIFDLTDKVIDIVKRGGLNERKND